MARDDFTKQVKDQIERRAGHRCSMPNCRRATSSPNPTAPSQSIRTGVAAHITAASPQGPRFDASLTPQERASTENGVWMCQLCARVIDISPNVFTIEVLRAIKSDAERRAVRASTAEDVCSKLIVDLQEFRDDLITFITQRAIDEPNYGFSRSTNEEERQRHWDMKTRATIDFSKETQSLYESLLEPRIIELLPRTGAILGEADKDYQDLAEAAEFSSVNSLAQKDLARRVGNCIGILEMR
ncbi:hypothetical protein ACGFNU_23435 [Spirillospora sp. NPDC048911]|uniref:hypothetical protein n=1 Tax=Spirillospora sp. NPDC048911 TaxID=3364527 RepID=UPI0037147929